MSSGWKLSRKAEEVVTSAMDGFGSHGIGRDHFPGILWSLGGEVRDGNGVVVRTLPAHYSLVLVKSEDVARFWKIDDERYGVIAFGPRDEDLNPPHKVIDYRDGELIAT